MSASILKGYLLYWGQTNNLNQPEIVVFQVWNGVETEHQISCLLPGNHTETERPTNRTTTSHWVFRMVVWFTISALQPILEVHLTLVLMVCYVFGSIWKS